MKFKKLLTLAYVIFSLSLFSQTDANGYTTVNLTMGPSYANRVFYDLSDNNIISQAADSWDIAFYRVSNMDFGIKVNDAKNILVYQVSATPSDYDTVDLSQENNWGSPLYNPDNTTKIQDGAFGASTLLPSGGFNYGWGTYDVTSHKIIGKVVYVLKYANGDYYKFFINEYFGGYTFKYAKWDVTNSNWGTNESRTISNGTDDAYFNYFSFSTGAKVPNLEPAKTNWDLMFTRYWNFYNGMSMYRLSGVIQNPNITVAKVQPETQEASTYTAPSASSYSNMITTIGHSWKPTSGVHTDVVYYIKNGSSYYRMYFISNGGASTGDISFKYKDITSSLATKEVGNKASFGLYPNPTVNKKVTLLFDIKEKSSNKGNIEIYDYSGKKLYEKEITNQNGFYKQDLNLSQLAPGNYLVKITYGGYVETKKLILK